MACGSMNLLYDMLYDKTWILNFCCVKLRTVDRATPIIILCILTIILDHRFNIMV